MNEKTKRHILATIVVDGQVDAVAPTFTISALSGASNVLAMQIVASEVVTGFAVGDITITAGGSLASFATSDNKTFTVSWTLAAGANTMDIAAGVCVDAAGNENIAATQYNAGFLPIQPDSTADIDDVIKSGDSSPYPLATSLWLGLNGGFVRRLLIRPSLTDIPTFATISSAVFTLAMEGESSTSARRLSLYKQKRDWIVTQASWNKYTSANNLQKAGGFGADDCEQTEFAGIILSATEANGAKAITLPATTKAALGAYGWLVMLSDETADSYLFITCNHPTPSQRPKLVIVYYVNP